MNRIPIVGPAVEPVTLAEMRTFLRVDDAVEDELVGALIKTAREWVEGASGRSLIAQAWRLILDQWPADREIDVPLSPLIAVDTVRVFDAGGQAMIVPPAMYRIDEATDPARLIIDPAAPAPGRPSAGIEIDVRVGYGATPESVPGPLRQAIRMLVARWFENRGDAPDVTIPLDVTALVAPFRRVRL